MHSKKWFHPGLLALAMWCVVAGSGCQHAAWPDAKTAESSRVADYAEESARTSQKPVAPCQLLTREDAERFFGHAMTSPDAAEGKSGFRGAPRKLCTYLSVRGPSENEPRPSMIRLAIFDTSFLKEQGSDLSSATDFFKHVQYEKTHYGIPPVLVPNLGDAAFWENGADNLHVLKNDVYAEIFVDRDFDMEATSRGAMIQERTAKRRAGCEQLMRDVILPRLD